jgi:Zn-dependent protease with chaperone function
VRYAEILARLQVEHNAKSKEAAPGETGIRDYLSTHPDTGERIRRVMAAEVEMSSPGK